MANQKYDSEKFDLEYYKTMYELENPNKISEFKKIRKSSNWIRKYKL